MSNEKLTGYLVLYDIRGIQDYIFKTNKLKEIELASKVVQNLYENAIDEVSAKIFKSCDKYSLLWKDKECNFFNGMLMEVVYIGGGNAYILFKEEGMAIKFNEAFSEHILTKTYSLQSAIAMVKLEDTYQATTAKLQNKMQIVKANMPFAMSMMNFSTIKINKNTGLPVRIIKEIDDSQEETYEESNLKKLDDLRMTKGKDSLIAIVHIDGNSMGKRIQEIMVMENDEVDQLKAFETSIEKIRYLSKSISETYANAYKNMEKCLSKFDPEKGLVRKVINAGDDITFICNGNYAISAVKFFLDEVSKCNMLNIQDNNYQFSACAGIAFIHSHFPFSEGYKVAEACCQNAKEKARQMDSNNIGNWFDYQFCTDISVTDLDNYRHSQYCLADGTKLLKRPYKLMEVDEFIKRIDEVDGLPNRWSKSLRDTYYLGKIAIEKLVRTMEAKGKKLTDSPYNQDEGTEIATYFDALEMHDHYICVKKINDENSSKHSGGRLNDKIQSQN